jgi:hypothetical protein
MLIINCFSSNYNKLRKFGFLWNPKKAKPGGTKTFRGFALL